MKVVIEFDIDEMSEGDVEENYRHIPVMIKEALDDYRKRREDPKKFYQRQCGSKRNYLNAKSKHPWDLPHLIKRVMLAKIFTKFDVYINP